MALPLSARTSCDVYRNTNAPPAAPDVAAVPCVVLTDWRAAQEAGDRTANTCSWTHVMLVEVNVDIRDAYIGRSVCVTQDTVYVPDLNGTPYLVVFIERVQRGTPHEHKRVFLDRQIPTWPTNEL